MPDFNPFDVDLEGDVAGGQSRRPWREAPLLDSEARSQTDRGYSKNGVGLPFRHHPWQGRQSTPRGVLPTYTLELVFG